VVVGISDELERIIWMMDETRADSHPKDWERIDSLYQELINLCGRNDVENIILDPVICIKKMVKEIKDNQYQAVIDLTKWLSPLAKKLFPYAEIINDFGITRVRQVDTPELNTTGHIHKCTFKRISELKKRLKGKKVLIMDDVSFSGGTGQFTEKVLKLENPDHAYLIINKGNLGPNPGAINTLAGRNIYSGFVMYTPNDDGWHLKDLHQHPRLLEAFNKSIEIQKLMNYNGDTSAEVKTALKKKSTIDLLFPDSYNTQQINEMSIEGRFILSEKIVLNGSYHAKNPLLWASKYFAKHVDRDKLINHQKEIGQIILELQLLSPGYEKVKPIVDEYMRSIK
jgi:hypoxanthine phosphoribosyltransferase